MLSDEKPRPCPNCRSAKIIPILYGLPTSETIKWVEQGKGVLGGCIVGPNQWHCKSCGIEYPSKPEIYGFNSILSDSTLDTILLHTKNHELANVGDSVLDLFLKEFEYSKNGSTKAMDNARKKYANNGTLTLVAKQIGLEDVLYGSSGLYKNPNYDKVLARTLEALIGGIYLENGIQEAKQFIKSYILPNND